MVRHYSLQEVRLHLKKLKKLSKFWKRKLKIKSLLSTILTVRPQSTTKIDVSADGWDSKGIPTSDLADIRQFGRMTVNYHLLDKTVAVVFKCPTKFSAKHIESSP